MVTRSGARLDTAVHLPGAPRQRSAHTHRAMAPTPLEDARGIVFADVGRRCAEVAAAIYRTHAAGADVFPVLLSPAPPTGDRGGVVVNVASLPLYPKGEFAGKTHVDAAVKHIKEPGGKVCFIFEAAHHLSSYRFQRAVETLRKIAGNAFNYAVRVFVLFDALGPVQRSPFTEARCFTATWFGGRGVVGTVVDLPEPELNPRTAEVARRCFDRRGIDPSDPFVSGFVAAISCRTPTTEVLRGGSTIVAATVRGLAGALSAAATVAWDWSPDDALVAESVYYGNDGKETRRKVAFPIASASRRSDKYFAAVLETVAEELSVRFRETGKSATVPRGTWLIWDGESTNDLIFDESTVDPDGFHCREPETAADPDIPVLRCRLYPAAREVEVPLYAALGEGVGLAVRVAGFGSFGDDPGAAPAILGTTATAAAAARDTADRTPVLAAELFSQEQLRTALRLVETAPTIYGLAPAGGGSLAFSLPPPFGNAQPIPDPTELATMVGRLVPRSKLYRIGIPPA